MSGGSPREKVGPNNSKENSEEKVRKKVIKEEKKTKRDYSLQSRLGRLVDTW